MAVPYILEIKVDLLTSNTEQKFQILEQILPLFNPMMELQNTTGYFDWTSLSVIKLREVQWSSRTVPQGTAGTDGPMDVASLSFEIPIWLSLPARVSKQGVIFKVLTNLYDEAGNLCNRNNYVDENDLLLGTRQTVTFENLAIFAFNGQITLLQPNAVVTQQNEFDPGVITSGTPQDWVSVLGAYGNIRNGISQIQLTYDTNQPNIIGTVSLVPGNVNILTYTVDPATLPDPTLPAVIGVVNPQKQAPGINGLANVATGQSYILTQPIGAANDTSYAAGWTTGNIGPVAIANDIITYTGNRWVRTFDSANTSNLNFVNNNVTNIEYMWNGSYWAKAWEGYYTNANWSIVI